jgi:uncharacterized membrane protein (UPF0136 family)
MALLLVNVTLGTYAALLAAGGVMGYVKAGSRPSLIAGLACAGAVLVALGLSLAGITLGHVLGVVLAVALGVFFGMRYVRKGRKFMPNGLMAVVSALVLALLAAAMFV